MATTLGSFFFLFFLVDDVYTAWNARGLLCFLFCFPSIDWLGASFLWSHAYYVLIWLNEWTCCSRSSHACMASPTCMYAFRHLMELPLIFFPLSIYPPVVYFSSNKLKSYKYFTTSPHSPSMQIYNWTSLKIRCSFFHSSSTSLQINYPNQPTYDFTLIEILLIPFK